MRLFFIPEACSLSCHIVLRELGLPFELVRVSSKLRRTGEGQDFLQVNPKGYVPALQLDDGDVLTECGAVLQYLGDLRPEAGLVAPAGTRERLRLQEMLTFIGMEIHGAFEPFFMAGMPEDAKELFRHRIARRYDQLAGLLAERDSLVGDRYGVADPYLFTLLRWSPWFGISLDRWPTLTGFAARVAERPAVQEAMAVEAASAPVT